MWSLIAKVFRRPKPVPTQPQEPRSNNWGAGYWRVRETRITQNFWAGLNSLRVNFNYKSDRRKVYIYNVNEERFEAGNPIIKRLVIPGRPANKRYIYVTSIPYIVNPTKLNSGEDTLETVPTSGIRVAVDLIQPDNLGTDLNNGPAERQCFAIGRDLAARGVFYSLSKPPKAKDLAAAHRRLRKYHQDIWDRAAALYFSGNTPFDEDFGKKVASAAKYLGIKKIPWKLRPKEESKPKDESSKKGEN